MLRAGIREMMESVSEISVAETSGGPFATRDGAEEGD
jgi:hypothetical protein